MQKQTCNERSGRPEVIQRPEMIVILHRIGLAAVIHSSVAEPSSVSAEYLTGRTDTGNLGLGLERALLDVYNPLLPLLYAAVPAGYRSSVMDVRRA